LKGNKSYTKSNVYVKEALEEAESYKGTKKEKMLSAANVSFITYEENTITADTVSQSELKKLTENTPGTAVINSIRSESLNKGLSVFEMLGFIAMACGLILFLIGKPIKKWMHGIN
jgi:POT family proton-dependent oligopeptide transporter